MNTKKILTRILSLIIVIISALLFSACSSDENNPVASISESDIIGVWKINSVSWITPEETGNYTHEELEALGLVWELTFNEDKSAEQVTNLSGPLTTQSGTWSLSGDKLSVTLKAPTTDEYGTTIYNCSLLRNSLNLCWKIENGSEYSSQFKKE